MASGFGFNSLNNSDWSTYSPAGKSVSLNDHSLQHGNIPFDETIGNSGQLPPFHGSFGSEHSMCQGSYSQFHQSFVNEPRHHTFVNTPPGSSDTDSIVNQDASSKSYRISGSSCNVEHSMCQGSYPQFHQPFVHPRNGSPGIVPMVNQAENSQAYHLNRSEYNTNRNPMSHRCIYLAKESFQAENSGVLSSQPSNHRSNYYQATFPTATQTPYAIPSTNSDIFQESQKFFQNKYDAIGVPCPTNEPSGNEMSINEDLLHPLTSQNYRQQYGGSDTIHPLTSQSLGSQNYRQQYGGSDTIHPLTSQSLGSQNYGQQYGGPDGIQDTYLQNLNFPGSDFLPSSNINHPSFVVESGSNICLSSYSNLPSYKPSGNDHSNPVAFPLSESDSDKNIIKDLHPSNYSDFTIKRNLYPSGHRQLADVDVKTDGLYSPKASIGDQFFTSQVLGPLTNMPIQSEAGDIHQFNPIIHQLSPKDSDTHRVTELPATKNETSIVQTVLPSNQKPQINSCKSQTTDLQSDIQQFNPVSHQLSPNDSDAHRVTELPADKNEASIVRSVLPSNQLLRNNSQATDLQSDIQQFNPIILQLSPKDSDALTELPIDKNEASIVLPVLPSNQQPRINSCKSQATDLQSDIHQFNPVSPQLPPKDSDAHRGTELPADKIEANIVRTILPSNQQPRINSRKNQATDSQSEKLHHKKPNKGKKPKHDSLEIRISNLDARAPAKIHRSNYLPDQFPDRFVTMVELLKLFQDLPKIDPWFFLNNVETVNVFIFGLVGCESIRLVATFARNSFGRILKTFGLAFQKSIKVPGITMTLNCWNLQNSESSADIRNPSKYTRNAIVLMYDVTRKINVYDIRPEIEFLQLTNLPILLVGDTSCLVGSKVRLAPYRDGRLMKDIYKFSAFFEFSIDSQVAVNGLFITAIDIAFRHEIKIDDL